MQRISLRLSINGSQPVSLDGQVLRSLKSTVTTLSGAASTSIDLFLPHDTRWPLHLRAMDRIVIQAAVVNRPGPLNSDDWETIFTGLLVDVPIAEAVETGLHVPLECASMYHLLEATTETAAQHEWRYLQSQMPLGTFITMAMSQMGFVQGATFQVEGGVDTGLGLVPLDAVDSSGFAVNPQFQSWAAILASLAKIAGRELYCDESGVINYRPSHYDHSSTGDIPSERLINVQASVDTDKGLVNRVNVRYTLEEIGVGSTSVYWPPLGEDIHGYDRAHYHERLLILPAPWLQNGGDALNLAQWVLSWAMSNTRPAVVTLNFWPEARVGQVYTLEWPVGTRTDYYLASVVHQVTPGGPAVTVLGLTYGRPPGFAWNQPVVPSTFGNSNSVSGQQLGTAISASNWWVTAYTPHDPKQAALPTFNDPTYGTYLIASSGAQYFQQGWRPGSSGILYDYSIRPCGYLPGYQVPELGNVTLSYGDQAMLANGQIVQIQDTGGGAKNRQFDVFIWGEQNADGTFQVPTGAGYGTYQTVQFLFVKNFTGALPGRTPLVPLGGVGVPPPPVPTGYPPVQDGPGDQAVATGAEQIALRLLRYQGFYRDTGVTWLPSGQDTGDPLANFCETILSPLGNGNTQCQCVELVRYTLIHYGGYRCDAYGNAVDTGNLASQGYGTVTGQLPVPGDIPYWNSPQENSQDIGHVAIVTAVTLPSAPGKNDGAVTVAQANCTLQIQNFPLIASGSSWVIGSNPGFGSWIGLMRPPGSTAGPVQ